MAGLETKSDCFAKGALTAAATVSESWGTDLAMEEALKSGLYSQLHFAAGWPSRNHTMKSVPGGTPPSSRRRVAFCPR